MRPPFPNHSRHCYLSKVNHSIKNKERKKKKLIKVNHEQSSFRGGVNLCNMCKYVGEVREIILLLLYTAKKVQFLNQALSRPCNNHHVCDRRCERLYFALKFIATCVKHEFGSYCVCETFP